MIDRWDAFACLLLAILFAVFVKYGGQPVAPLDAGLENDVAEQTAVEQTETPAVAYELTAEERDLIERVVMGESGGEEYIGQQAVAQCILNACELAGNRPAAIIEGLRYTTHRPEASQSVKDAVSSVFDNGEKVIKETAVYFYAPELVYSEWHETQQYVCTIGCHKFFERSE